MESVYEKKEACCGCGSCAHTCPTSAITMRPDAEGFLYPVIDSSLCVDCGRCKQVCAFLAQRNPTPEPLAYAVKLQDRNKRAQSQSGGAFTAFAEIVLAKGGTVYGAAFDDALAVRHVRIDKIEDLHKVKGSKYVQSDLGDIHVSVRADLEGGKTVLFSGTPCQIDGIRRYLLQQKVACDRLLLCDLVCHGVPSPLLYREYLEMLKKKHNHAVTNFNFRYKALGWHDHFEQVETGTEKHYYDLYTNLFYMHIMHRPVCYHCPYANINRPSDITVGDFWGIEDVMPQIDDNKGISLVLVNTEKGKALFSEAQKLLVVWQSSLKECLQDQLRHPAVSSPRRAEFFEDYAVHGAEYVFDKYGKSMGWKKQLAIKLHFYGLLKGTMWKCRQMKKSIHRG